MNQLIVSSSPHVRAQDTTQRIMLDVLIALLPTTIAGILIYGIGAMLVVLSCVCSALVAEYLFNLITKRKQTVADLSAVVTGLILALNLHANVPVWQCVIGSVFAIVVVKCLFGGLGCNFANPAVTGRIFLFLCFAGTVGGGAVPKILESTVLGTSATPLESMASGGYLPSIIDMLLGIRGGAIGESCILAIVIGFAYLVIRGVIKLELPLIYVGSVFLLSLLITNDLVYSVYQILAGGLVFAAVFMITDYVTTPITRTGRMIFAVGCGIITVLIRFYGSYPEGVSFSVLIMNILSPYIEKWTMKKPLGGNGK